MSKILVNEIGHTGDTTAMTIDSTGLVSQPTKPFFQISKLASSGQGGANGHLSFNTIHENQGTDWDTSNHYFVAPVNGVYQFNLLGFSCNSNGGLRSATASTSLNLEVYTSGSWVIEAQVYAIAQSSDYHIPLNASHTTKLSAGDKFRYNVTNGYLYYNNDATYRYLSASGFMVG